MRKSTKKLKKLLQKKSPKKKSKITLRRLKLTLLFATIVLTATSLFFTGAVLAEESSDKEEVYELTLSEMQEIIAREKNLENKLENKEEENEKLKKELAVYKEENILLIERVDLLENKAEVKDQRIEILKEDKDSLKEMLYQEREAHQFAIDKANEEIRLYKVRLDSEKELTSLYKRRSYISEFEKFKYGLIALGILRLAEEF